MPKQYKTEDNKEEGRKYYGKIMETIEDSISGLEKELKLYKDTPKIVRGVLKNLNERKEQLKYYQNLSKEYKNEGWII